MEKHLKYAKLIANLLDARFEFLGIRFGINTFFQVIPGIGDVIAAVLSLYIISIGIRMNVPGDVIAKMISNIVVSFIAGLIPFVGDTFYIFYRPNMRNVKLLDEYTRSAVPQPQHL